MIDIIWFQRNEDGDDQVHDLLDITEEMIKTVGDKLKQASKDGQITVLEDKKRDARIECALCHITPCHFTRHIEEKHSGEPIISSILNLPKGSKERRNGWIKLRNCFCFLHNKTVLERGTGGLVVSKVARTKYPSHLNVCPYCYGLYCDLHGHAKHCVGVGCPPPKKVKRAPVTYVIFSSPELKA
jgi:hypothetical protein